MTATDWPSPWKDGELVPCSWCGRERLARKTDSNTCMDCQPYEAYARALKAGDAA